MNVLMYGGVAYIPVNRILFAQERLQLTVKILLVLSFNKLYQN